MVWIGPCLGLLFLSFIFESKSINSSVFILNDRQQWIEKKIELENELDYKNTILSVTIFFLDWSKNILLVL